MKSLSIILILALILYPFAVLAQEADPVPAETKTEETASEPVNEASGAADTPSPEAAAQATEGPRAGAAPVEVDGPAATAAPAVIGGAEGPQDVTAQDPDTEQDEAVEKLEAAVILTITVEDFKAEESRAALDWTMRSRLEENYRLINPKRVSDLEHQAATATNKEYCTSEDCLRALKRRLLTDRLFSVSLVPDGEFTQLYLTLLRGDDKIIRSEVCAACTLETAKERLLALLDELIVADLEKPDLKAVAASIPVPPEEKKKEKDEGFSMPWWLYVAAGVLALAALGGGGGDSGTSSSPADGGSGGDSGSTSGSVGVNW